MNPTLVNKPESEAEQRVENSPDKQGIAPEGKEGVPNLAAGTSPREGKKDQGDQKSEQATNTGSLKDWIPWIALFISILSFVGTVFSVITARSSLNTAREALAETRARPRKQENLVLKKRITTAEIQFAVMSQTGASEYAAGVKPWKSQRNQDSRLWYLGWRIAENIWQDSVRRTTC